MISFLTVHTLHAQIVLFFHFCLPLSILLHTIVRYANYSVPKILIACDLVCYSFYVVELYFVLLKRL